MRIARVHRAGTCKRALLFGIIRATSGFAASGVVRTLFYRPKFFGEHQSRLTYAVMRGPSEWSVGERELFAAFVSRLSQCPF